MTFLSTSSIECKPTRYFLCFAELTNSHLTFYTNRAGWTSHNTCKSTRCLFYRVNELSSAFCSNRAADISPPKGRIFHLRNCRDYLGLKLVICILGSWKEIFAVNWYGLLKGIFRGSTHKNKGRCAFTEGGNELLRN